MGNIWINVGVDTKDMEGPKPSAYRYLEAHSANKTFAVPQTGWYKVYCVGKSGDGGGNNYGYEGSGGGGSGGLAVSELWLKKGQSVAIAVSGSQTKFGNYLYATSGQNGSGQNGGTGGTGYNGNVANRSGFTGGKGGNVTTSKTGLTGATGGNGGMAGGVGGTSSGTTYHPGSGGGGGARLGGDDVCKYIAATYTSQYKAARGADRSADSNVHAQSYPWFVGPDMKLYGGGGGGGGAGFGSSPNSSMTSGGKHSSGTPGVVIIEQGVL